MKETEKRNPSSSQYPPQSPLIRGIFGFTLVELIIVITILVILATIAFMSFQWYTSKSRDANRATTAKNIETWLSLFQVRAGVYPIQSTWAMISLSWSPITVQWNLDESIARVINLNEVPKDPKTGEPYNYISDKNGKGWKVLYYLENTPDYAFLTQSYAESEARTPVVKGQWPWVLLDTGSQMVTKNVDLFGVTQSWETFTILVNDTTKVTGSGLELGGGFQNFAEKWGRLEAPKTCPTGFIPVPWNAEFMQPWFCVAKYEMGYENEWLDFWDTLLNTIWSWTVHPTCTKSYNSSNSGESCTLSVFKTHNGWIVSKVWKFPIAYLTQHESLQACKSLWGTAHLITNNEWMTIARNIEANPMNRNSGKVWSGAIYNGVSNSVLWCGSWTTQTIYSWALSLPNTWVITSWPWGNDDCDTKRQLKLSNWEVIWDLAGNVWEYVNKANTIDGMNYNTWKLKFDDVRDHWNISNSWTSNEYYNWHKTGWSASTIPEEIRKKYGPSKTTYTHTINGVWNIQGWYTRDTTQSHNVLLRGGSAAYASNPDIAGIYTMYLTWTSSTQSNSVGFRCAF